MKFSISAATVALALFLAGSAFAGNRPNIVMVLIDDMGWRDFSCFGNTEARTPNIDALAKEGIRFHQFYVNAPICSPSRAALTTGQYPQRWRINSYLAERTENQRRGVADWLDLEAPTLARILHDAGYATGHFGKWHLGGQRDVGEAPLITEYGFDKSLTNFEGLGPRILPLCDAYDGSPPKRHALGSDNLGRGPIEWEDRSKITGRFVNAAVDFIKEAEREGKPFYVNVWLDDVHSPFFPPQALRNDETKRGLYLRVLEAMDEQLGPLFATIRNDPKLRENTLILVFSDNGPEAGAGSSTPFRGNKGELYEGGIRSPLIAWAPGGIAPGQAGAINNMSVFASIDLVPSILQIAGVRNPGAAFDGVDVSKVLLGKSKESRGAPLFFRRPPDRKNANGKKNLPDLAVRDGDWKLLCEYDGSSPELYDLKADPGEKHNLASSNAERVRAMTEAVLAWNATLPKAADDKSSRDNAEKSRQ